MTSLESYQFYYDLHYEIFPSDWLKIIEGWVNLFKFIVANLVVLGWPNDITVHF